MSASRTSPLPATALTKVIDGDMCTGRCVNIKNLGIYSAPSLESYAVIINCGISILNTLRRNLLQLSGEAPNGSLSTSLGDSGQ